MFCQDRVTIDHNHLIARWLLREIPSINVCVAAVANACLALSKVSLEDIVNASPELLQNASLKLPTGGFLLGKVDSEDHRNFVAKTYISESMSKEHNLNNCVNPNEERVQDWDWNDEFTWLQKYFASQGQ